MTVETLPDRDDGVRVVRLGGELDVLTVKPLLADLPALAVPGSPLVLDLSDVTFFDSAAVRLVDDLAGRCSRNGDAFRVVAPPGGRARRVLELVGLAAALASDDLPAAVERVRAQT